MDKKVISNISSTDSFYFQLCPIHFKVQHSFAKNMVSGSVYRLAIYKGIQKNDEMIEPIKGKLIGGKIVFEQILLSFYLAVFTPTRNIEFTVKVFETKPNQEEVEIALHKIKSGDFIKSFKNIGNSIYREQAQLLQGFTLVFDLFVHNSKLELEKISKEHLAKSKVEERSRLMNNRMQTPKKNENRSDDISQSDGSENSMEGGMFSSKKKLSRRRGHDGRMRSRHGSRQNSQISQRQGSVRSSKKGVGPFPHTSKDQRFIHSPKKASPPKVDDSRLSPKISENRSPKSQITRPQNLVSVGRAKDSNGSEISKGKLPQTPTKPTRVQSNIQRSQSTKKELSNQRSSQILPTQTPVPSRKQPLTKREEPSKSPFVSTSPKSGNIHNLQIKGNQKIFDIQHKKNEIIKPNVPEIPRVQRSKTDTLPPRNLATRTPVKNNESPVKREEPQVKIQKQVKVTLIESITHVVAEVPAPQVEQVQQQNAKPSSPQRKQNEQHQEEGFKQQPAAQKRQVEQRQPTPAKQGSVKSKGSQPTIPNIAIKGKQLADQYHQKLKLSSLNVKRIPAQPEQKSEVKASNQFESGKDLLFYALFFIASAFLFYNAITPSRKV